MLIEEKPTGINRFGRLLQLKCPKCGKAKVFYKAKYPGVRPQMKATCDNCGYEFHKDHEHYHRAVYLSYLLTFVEAVFAYALVSNFVYGLTPRDMMLASAAVALFLSIWNYKMARVLLMNVLPNES